MTATTFAIDPAGLSAGLLAGRLTLGLAMAAHGSQKLFGWFGGYGLAATGGYFEQLGFRPGRAYAAVASTTEVVGGLLVALGLLGPIGPALVLSVMVVAAVAVHWKCGFFAQSNGIEVPFLYAAGAVALALAGPGRYSLDALIGLEWLWAPRIAALALAAAVIGALANLLSRGAAAPKPATAA
jgi:putative oxidoreductase